VARRRPKPLPQYTKNVCRRVVLPNGYQYFTTFSINYEFIRDRWWIPAGWTSGWLRRKEKKERSHNINKKTRRKKK
jgi:hypothetical protein